MHLASKYLRRCIRHYIALCSSPLFPDRCTSAYALSYSSPLLGVTITKTFNFQSHIKMVISKANRRLNLLRLLSGTNWGCKPKIIMQLYKQYIRPVLEYGAIALLSAPKTTLEKIQLVQNKAIKIAYRLPWCTSTRTIHQLAGIEPIKNCFQSLANKFIHSLEKHSELFKLQKDQHNAIKKRDKTNFLDKLLENYKKQYGNENGMWQKTTNFPARRTTVFNLISL